MDVLDESLFEAFIAEEVWSEDRRAGDQKIVEDLKQIPASGVVDFGTGLGVVMFAGGHGAGEALGVVYRVLSVGH